MDEEEAAPYLVNMEAFCLVEGLNLVMDLVAFNAAGPPALGANPTAPQRAAHATAMQDWLVPDKRFYGFMILSLVNVPMLRDRILGSAAVLANPRRGSVLMQAFKDDLFANANPAVYSNRLTKIRAYRQKKDQPIPVALAEINRLHSGLPAAYARTDMDKILQLRSSLLPKYAELVKTVSLANPIITYSAVCDHLVRESVSETLISLSNIGEKEDAHLVAEQEPDEAFIAEDRGRSRSPGPDRYRKMHRHRDDYSRSPSSHRSPHRSPMREKYYPREQRYSRSPHRYSRSPHRHNRSQERRPYTRGFSSTRRSFSRSPDRSMVRGRSPSPHPRGALKYSVNWKDQRSVPRCYKCNQPGHKSFECGNK